MLLKALTTLIVILLISGISLIFERIARKIKVQRIIFELVFGSLLGSTLLIQFVDKTYIADIAILGSIVLLFSVGFGSNFEHLTKKRKEIIILASAGVIIPFILVFLAMLAMHQSLWVALFITAAAVSSSIGISARILLETNTCDTNIGNIILGSAVLDDVYGIIMLTVFVALLKPIGFLTFGFILGAIFLFLAIISMLFIFENWSKDRLAEKHRKRIFVPTSASLPLLAKIFGFSPVLGAFFSGLLLSKLDIHHRYYKMLRVIYRILVPIFFVYVGSQINLFLLNRIDILLIGLVVTVMIIIGQFLAGLSLGGFIGLRQSITVGLGMISRGEVALIIATTGFELGIVTKDIFSSIIIMVFLTTLIQPIIFPKLLNFCKEKVTII